MNVKPVAARVHSMRDACAAADWPALDAGELQWLLHGIGLPSTNVQLRWASPRPFSTAGIIDTARGALFVKRHHASVRDAQGLAEEHAFMRYLRVHGAQVPALVADAGGQTVFARGSWVYELQDIGDGVDVYRDALSWTPFKHESHARAAGRALARLHGAAKNYDAPRRTAHLLVANFRSMGSSAPLAFLAEELARRPALNEYLQTRSWQEDFSRVLLPLQHTYLTLSYAPVASWGHHDWHASNLLWSSAGEQAEVRSVLDFGLCDRTCAVFDLATAIERNCIAWLDVHEGRRAPVDLEMVRALLQGYCEQAPLRCESSRALIAMLPIVHVDFALSEIEYFHGITRSNANAHLAYDAFLLGHAEWFGSPEGHSLLHFLEHELI